MVGPGDRRRRRGDRRPPAPGGRRLLHRQRHLPRGAARRAGGRRHRPRVGRARLGLLGASRHHLRGGRRLAGGRGRRAAPADSGRGRCRDPTHPPRRGHGEPAMKNRSRFKRYDGGDPLAPPVDLAEALDAIGQDVMAGYSPERAMREFLRRGGRDQQGLDDLARRVAAKRRELTQRHNLDGTLQEVRELLDRAVLEERKQLARDAMMDDADRAFREMQLDSLPSSTAAAVNDLASYDWQSSTAREAYDRIKDLLGREILDQRFAGMKQALESATDDDRAAVNDMLRDLNELLAKHRRGEDTQADFQEFMAKHGQFFPEDPQSVEELVDALAQRAAAAQRLLQSMSPEQRDELMRLSAQAFGSPELMAQLGQLDSNLQALRPGEDWSGSERFEGEEGLGLGDGTGVLQDIAELDELSEQLSQSYNGSRLDDLDLDALARQLGEGAAVSARTLAEIERAMQEGGYLRRDAEGDLRLSPQAMRRLGKSLLRDTAKQLSG